MERTTHAIHEFGGFLPSIFEFPIYFPIVSFAFSVALYWWVRRADSRGLGRNQALDLALVLMFAGLFGARAFHVFFEEPLYYLENPVRVLELWQGGFVWYGGALCGTGAALLWARRKKLEIPVWLDLSAPVVALGYALGRAACLLTGCCFGDVCVLALRSTDFRFRYPTQAFAILWEAAVVAALVILENRARRGAGVLWLRRPGRLFVLWLALHALGRLLMELMRGDPRGPEFMGLSIATWISVGLLLFIPIALRLTGSPRPRG